MTLDTQQEELCASNPMDFSDLKAVFLNCTLKAPDQASHTGLLMGTSAEIMRRNHVVVQAVRVTAHQIAFGVYPDMTEHGWERDDWPALWKQVLYALSQLGYTIPPQTDCGWIGEIGPGASYGDDGAGFDNDFTRRNTTIMTWNLLHMASGWASSRLACLRSSALLMGWIRPCAPTPGVSASPR